MRATREYIVKSAENGFVACIGGSQLFVSNKIEEVAVHLISYFKEQDAMDERFANKIRGILYPDRDMDAQSKAVDCEPATY